MKSLPTALLHAALLGLTTAFAFATAYTKSGNFGSLTLNTGDSLTLSANAQGKVWIAGSNVVINGNNHVLKGPGTTLGTTPAGTTWYAVIQSNPTTSTCTVKNIVITPNSPNNGTPCFAIRMQGSGHTLNNVDVDVGTNLAHMQDGIELWGTGYATGCDIKSADDAIKVYGKGSLAENCSVNLQDNGSAVQFGWGTYQSGTGSTFIVRNSSIGGTCYGNGNGYNSNTDNYSGSIVAGKFTATTEGHQATGLTMSDSFSNWGTAVHLTAKGGTFTANNTTVSMTGGGTFSSLVAYAHGAKGIWLVADTAALSNVTISTGGAANGSDVSYYLSNGGTVSGVTVN